MARKLFLSIGECMIEMASLGDDTFRLGIAGDTLNTAWYARALMPAETWDISYFTRLGTDPYSQRIRDFLQSNQIGTDLITTDPVHQPGLYVIDLKNGERSFSYWRQNSAAKLLCDDEGAIAHAISKADIVYFSGITLAILTTDRRQALLRLIGEARAAGKTTVFDPNIRPKLWENEDTIRASIIAASAVSSLTMPSFDDERSLFGDTSPEDCAKRYRSYGSEMVVVKNGGDDMVVSAGNDTLRIGDLPVVDPVDTTGAGDSFNGAFLAAYLETGNMERAALKAHKVAASVIAHRGALMPMPDIQKIGN